MMNPFDQITILNIVVNEVAMYEPICMHMKNLIKAYIIEILKMDIEISSILKKIPILKPHEAPKDIEIMKVGFFRK